MNAIRLIALALPLAASVALAQTPTTPPSPSTATTPARPLAYDVVSIKQNKSDSGGGLGRATPDGDTNINTLLVFQIGPAYGVEPDDIYGLPDWAKSNRYGVKFPPVKTLRPQRPRTLNRLTPRVLAYHLWYIRAHNGARQFHPCRNPPRLRPATS